MEGAVMAPSGVNLQPWYFVVIESQDAVEQYRELMKNKAENFRKTLEARFPNRPDVVEDTLSYMATMGGAPVVVLAFINKASLSSAGKASPYLQSVAAAIENLLLLATEKGLGSCWMSAPIAMGIEGYLEEKYAPGRGNFVAAIALGYPDQDPAAPPRKADRVVFL